MKYLGKAPQEVIDELPKHPYDLYLLLDIDLPWQDDPLRDFPHLREHFLDVWHKELQALNANYVTISGTGQNRYQNAVNAIDAYINRDFPINRSDKNRINKKICMIPGFFIGFRATLLKALRHLT
jgi:nicotinamide riboside kinase